MPKLAAVVAPPDRKMCNPYFLISETNAETHQWILPSYEYTKGVYSFFRNSKRSLHLIKFLNINSSEFGEIFAHNKYVSKFVTGHKLLSVRDMATVFQSRYMSVLLLGIKIDT